MIYEPLPHQDTITDWIKRLPYVGPWADMGLGKTVATLTAIDWLLKNTGIRKVLVVAPKRVADSVWSAEIEKWDHLRHLTYSKILGTEKQRKAAVHAKADIYLINRENLVWLTAYLEMSFPFDMAVIDESSSFKNHASQRFKVFRKVRPLIKRVVILTGTPSPNGLLDIWSQIYMLDRGQRLGENITAYRKKYFRRKILRNGEYDKFNYELVQGNLPDADLLGGDINEKEIYDKISDIVFTMKTADYVNLPPLIERDIEIQFPPELQKQYNKFEREQVLKLMEADTINAVNAAALTNKLLQFSNGAVYDDEKVWHGVHDMKLNELAEILDDSNGQPVLVFYSYKHDLERIKARFKEAVELKGNKEIDAWNRGEIPLMVAHPASAGHGLNLQHGGNIVVWFGLNWSLELYQQANKRLHRQGQTRPVIVHRLICVKSMDQDVAAALIRKEKGQDALMEAVKARIHKHLNS